jgi:hypothetical protein
MSDERPAPGSMLDAWDTLAGAVRTTAEVARHDLRTSWKPWAIGCALAWLGLVVATVLR